MHRPDDGDVHAAEARLAPLAGLLRGSGAPMTDAQLRRGWHRLAAGGRSRGPVGVRLASGLALLAVVCGGALVARQRLRPAPLVVRAAGAEIDGAGAVRPTGAAASLVFSDGTHVRLDRVTRGRIAALDAHGARIGFDEGTADVAVVRRPGARWTFQAGPFTVQVKGTAFRVAWSRAREELVLAMRTGEVRVVGPGAPNGVTVRGTQRLRVAVRSGQVDLHDGATAAVVQRLPAPAPALDPPAEHPAPRRQRAAGPDGRSWARLLAEGDPGAVVRQAERRGLEASFAQAPLPELFALADAARYLRRDPVARRALLATRARFPRAREAHDAAFLLGRLTESVGADAALTWYDRYLAEAPNGAYVAEALGRKMTVLQKLHGNDRARPVAETYLRRFPNGSYAEPARVLAGRR